MPQDKNCLIRQNRRRVCRQDRWIFILVSSQTCRDCEDSLRGRLFLFKGKSDFFILERFLARIRIHCSRLWLTYFGHVTSNESNKDTASMALYGLDTCRDRERKAEHRMMDRFHQRRLRRNKCIRIRSFIQKTQSISLTAWNLWKSWWREPNSANPTSPRHWVR